MSALLFRRLFTLPLLRSAIDGWRFLVRLVCWFVLGGLRRVSHLGEAVAASSEEKFAIKWIVVVTLLGLSPDWFWPLPVAIVSALSIFVFDRVRGKSIAVRFFAAAACGAVASFVWLRVLDTRPIRPWFADDRFAEIFSFSLGQWGVSHNPMMMGESISYHWFSFAWVGAIANMSNESIEIMLAQFGPMIIGFGCAILGYSISRLLVSRPSTAIVAVSLTVVVDAERLFRGFGFHAFQLSSFSQFFARPWVGDIAADCRTPKRRFEFDFSCCRRDICGFDRGEKLIGACCAIWAGRVMALLGRF